MTLTIKHLQGALAGREQTFDDDLVRIGRDPLNDVALHPERDIDASAEHAEIRREDGVWWIVDLDSTNGTFVNGERAERRKLRSGDVIELAPGGPRFEVHFEGDASAAARPSRSGGTLVEPPKAANVGHKTLTMMINEALEKSRDDQGRGRTTMFIREAVAQAVTQSSRRQRLAVGAVLVVLVGLIGWALYRQGQMAEQARLADEALRLQEAAVAQQRQQLLSAERQQAEAIETITALQVELEAAQRDLAAAERDNVRDDARIDELVTALHAQRNQLEQADARIADTRAQLLAMQAAVDAAVRDGRDTSPGTEAGADLGDVQAVYDRAAPATYRLYAVPSDGGERVPVCTAFAIRADGLLASTGHCVRAYLDGLDARGDDTSEAGTDRSRWEAVPHARPDRRYPVVSGVTYPNTAAGIEGRDLGIFKILTEADLPDVLVVADAPAVSALEPGAAVAVLGFPANDGESATRVVLSAAVVTDRGPADDSALPGAAYVLYYDGPALGTSGGPVLDLGGRVVAVHQAARGSRLGSLALRADGEAHGVRADLLWDMMVAFPR